MKSPLTKAKDKLWKLCRELAAQTYDDKHCYTCGNYIEGNNRHLGHFITKSVCSRELAYDLDNLRWQCYRCNINLSGNWPEFERRMIKEKGKKFVDKLKDRNIKTKGGDYGLAWINNKIEEYSALLKDMV